MQSGDETTGISFSLSVDNERAEHITSKLSAFNQAHSGAFTLDIDTPPPAAPLEVYVSDGEGSVIGGLVGRTHSIRDWFEVSVIWVEESFRGRGLGRQLIELSEQEAIRRGCRYARLATSDFQASGFYALDAHIKMGKQEDNKPV